MVYNILLESLWGPLPYEPNYWDINARTNSVDPDQTPHNAASDQGLHCFPLTQQFLGTWMEGKRLIKILRKKNKNKR